MAAVTSARTVRTNTVKESAAIVGSSSSSGSSTATKTAVLSSAAMPSSSSAATAAAQPSSSSAATTASSAAAPVAKPIPTIILDRTTNKKYEKGKFLGKGGFAKCYEMIDLDDRRVYAGKIVAKSTLDRHRAKEKLATEIKIHRALSHKHVVGFHGFFEDKENVYILLELCSNKSLMELQKRRTRLTEEETRYYMLQIIDACQYMHTHKVIHRDLKLGNLFLDENMHIKVGDFGLATTVSYDGERKKTLCGTPNYIAPEVLDGKQGHSYEVDVWSIGCILYTMLIGRPPFETSKITTTYQKIKQNDYHIPSSPYISEEAKMLIRASLDSVPTQRPSLDAMKAHPFFHTGYVPAVLPATALSFPPTFEAAGKPRRDPLRTLNSIRSEEPMKREVERREEVVATATQAAHPIKTEVAPAPVAATPATAATTGAGPTAATRTVSAVSSTSTDTPLRFEEAGVTVPGSGAASAAGEVPRSRSARDTSDPKTSLSFVHRHLIEVTTRQAKASASDAPAPLSAREQKNCMFISKWVDYSNKYGLGYQLSDGSAGVLFNDATKIVLAPDQEHIELIDRDANGCTVSRMTLKDYPESVAKKVTLLKHFRSYMSENLLNGGELLEVPKYNASSTKLAHVRKWLRTKHAIVFRLSNGIIQINFFDHTKVIINAPLDTVTFIDKERKTQAFSLEEIAKSNHRSLSQLVSRLSYAIDVVEHMIKSGQR